MSLSYWKLFNSFLSPMSSELITMNYLYLLYKLGHAKLPLVPLILTSFCPWFGNVGPVLSMLQIFTHTSFYLFINSLCLRSPQNVYREVLGQGREQWTKQLPSLTSRTSLTSYSPTTLWWVKFFFPGFPMEPCAYFYLNPHKNAVK